jgi:acyl-CoA dehydrogenase
MGGGGGGGGGLGLNLTQDVELAMELGYTSLALRSMFGTNNGIAGQVLVNYGTDAQKAEWLERIASGEVVASFALTEPGAGSNPAGLRTKAVRDGDEWSSTAPRGSSPTPRTHTSS